MKRTSQPDHWAVLGLAPGADLQALKRAFRAQARRWHPDLNGSDPIAEERFKLVNEAYAVLSDPRRREAWEAGIDLDQSPPADAFASGFPAFFDYLEALDGRGSRRRSGESVPAEEEFEASAPEPPPPSGVTYSPPPPPPVTASNDEETVVALTPEQALAGERLELVLRDGTCVEVWTPPLAGDGWRLRLAGVVPGGADHFLQLQVRTPEGLRIDGLRVNYQLDLNPADAVLGCNVIVPTLEGPVKLNIPSGSSSGRLLRLRGRGLRVGDRCGDQYVEVRVVVPEAIGDDERALYRRLQDLASTRR
ncbi:MAG: DnaJ domain-containing protein [Cyanobacteriota bacterium]|nr:DnaJ domain-containing protein [Cyanobacteriota bacterium]